MPMGMNDADLRFQATLEDDVSPKIEQLEKKLKQMGASPAEIKMMLRAYDEITPKLAEVQKQVDAMPTEHLISVKANTDNVKQELMGVQASAADPIQLSFIDNLKEVGDKFFSLKTRMALPMMGAGGGSSMLTGFGGGGVIAGAALGGVGLMQQGVAVNQQMEQSMVTLTQTLRDQSQAQAEMKELIGFAQKTPFQYQDVLAADVRLRSYQIPTKAGEGGPNNKGWLEPSGNMAAALGTPITQAVEAIADARQGYFVRMMSYGIRMMREDFQKGGKYSGMSYEQGLERALKRFDGAMEMQSKTMTGVTSNIKDILEQQVLQPLGKEPFDILKTSATAAYEKLNDPDTLRKIGDIMQTISRAQDDIWLKLQEGRALFDAHMKQPLTEILHNIMEIGKAFGKAFGGTTGSVLKTVGEAFLEISGFISGIVGKFPGLVGLYGTFKALSMLGFTGLSTPFLQLAHSINPLSFSISGIVKSLATMPGAIAKAGVFLLAKHFLEAKEAADSFNRQMEKTSQTGLEQLNQDAELLALNLGKSTAEMKNLATFAATGMQGQPGTAQQHGAGAVESAKMATYMQEQFGSNPTAMAQMIKTEIKRTDGTGGPNNIDQLYQRAAKTAVGLEALGRSADDAARMIFQFGDVAGKAGFDRFSAPDDIAALQTGIMRGGGLSDKQVSLYKNVDTMTKSLFEGFAAPSIDDIQKLTNNGKNTDILNKYFGMSNPSAGKARDVFNIGHDIDAQYRANNRATQSTKDYVEQYAPSAKVPGVPNPYLAQGLDSNLSSLRPFSVFGKSELGKNQGAAMVQQLVPEWTKAETALENLNDQIGHHQQLITELTNKQIVLQQAQGSVNMQLEAFGHQMAMANRAVEDQSLAMSQWQFQNIRPLEREMTQLGNTISIVSNNMSKAQHEMSIYAGGLFTGEQAALDQMHALELYNKELQLLKLNYTSIGADLGAQSYKRGFSSTVKPMAGISLEMQMERLQKEQQRKQLEYDLKYGEERYKLQQASRSKYDKMEKPFAERMSHVKDAVAKTDEYTDAQYRLGQQQFDLGQKMFHANEYMQDQQDILTGLQLNIQAMQQSGTYRDLQDQQYKLGREATKVNMGLEKQNIALTRTQSIMDDLKEKKENFSELFDAIVGAKGNDNLERMRNMVGYLEKIGVLTEEQAKNIRGNIKRLDMSESEFGILGDPRGFVERWFDRLWQTFTGLFTGQTWGAIGQVVRTQLTKAFGGAGNTAGKWLDRTITGAGTGYSLAVAGGLAMTGPRWLAMSGAAKLANAFVPGDRGLKPAGEIAGGIGRGLGKIPLLGKYLNPGFLSWEQQLKKALDSGEGTLSGVIKSQRGEELGELFKNALRPLRSIRIVGGGVGGGMLGSILGGTVGGPVGATIGGMLGGAQGMTYARENTMRDMLAKTAGAANDLAHPGEQLKLFGDELKATATEFKESKLGQQLSIFGDEVKVSAAEMKAGGLSEKVAETAEKIKVADLGGKATETAEKVQKSKLGEQAAATAEKIKQSAFGEKFTTMADKVKESKFGEKVSETAGKLTKSDLGGEVEKTAEKVKQSGVADRLREVSADVKESGLGKVVAENADKVKASNFGQEVTKVTSALGELGLAFHKWAKNLPVLGKLVPSFGIEHAGQAAEVAGTVTKLGRLGGLVSKLLDNPLVRKVGIPLQVAGVGVDTVEAARGDRSAKFRLGGTAIGGTIGAILGAPAGGVGAVPGAAIGAGVGAAVGDLLARITLEGIKNAFSKENIIHALQAPLKASAFALGVALAIFVKVPFLLAMKAIGQLPNLGKAILRGLSSLFNGAVSYFTDPAFKEHVNNAIWNFAENTANTVVNALKSVWDIISSFFSGLPGMLADQFKSGFGITDALGFQTGIERVPQPGVTAVLHPDEAVLTASQASMWRQQKANSTAMFAPTAAPGSSSGGFAAAQVPSSNAQFQVGVSQSSGMQSGFMDIEAGWKTHLDIIKGQVQKHETTIEQINADSNAKLVDTNKSGQSHIQKTYHHHQDQVEEATKKHFDKMQSDTKTGMKGMASTVKDYSSDIKSSLGGAFNMDTGSMGSGPGGFSSEKQGPVSALTGAIKQQEAQQKASRKQLKEIQHMDKDDIVKLLEKFRELKNPSQSALKEASLLADELTKLNILKTGKPEVFPGMHGQIGPGAMHNLRIPELTEERISVGMGAVSLDALRKAGTQPGDWVKGTQLDSDTVKKATDSVRRVKDDAQLTDKNKDAKHNKDLQTQQRDHWTTVTGLLSDKLKDSLGIQDDGMKKIGGVTFDWLDKIVEAVKKLDEDLGITEGGSSGGKGGKGGGAKSTSTRSHPGARAHGGLETGVGDSKGRIIRVAEEGDEVIIPLAPHRRNRAIELVKQTVGRLGGTNQGVQGLQAANGMMVGKDGAYDAAKKAFDIQNYSRGGFTIYNSATASQEQKAGSSDPKSKQGSKGKPFTGGSTFEATAYGPPWNAMEGGGITSTGVKLYAGKPNYVVAIDPSVVPYHSKMKIWPNPFDYQGAFSAEDTGGAIVGNRIDFFDWKGRGHQNAWGRRNVKAQKAANGGTIPGYAAGGTMVPVPSSIPQYDSNLINSAILPTVMKFAKQFGLQLNDAYGPGHASVEHTIYGTAADFGPAGGMGGNWDNVDRAVTAAVQAGYTPVYYDGTGGSINLPPHGKPSTGGDHAHITFLTAAEYLAGAKAGKFSSLGGLSVGAGATAVADLPGMPKELEGMGIMGKRIHRALSHKRKQWGNKMGHKIGTGSIGSGLAGLGVARGPIKEMAHQMVKQIWGESEWPAYDQLEMSEAGYNPEATNPSSGAFGLGQFLGATSDAYAKYGATSHDPKLQLQAMMRYISDRYNTPSAAWDWHLAHNWYAGGGIVPQYAGGIDRVPRDNYPAILHKDEKVVPAGTANWGRGNGPVGAGENLTILAGLAGHIKGMAENIKTMTKEIKEMKNGQAKKDAEDRLARLKDELASKQYRLSTATKRGDSIIRKMNQKAHDRSGGEATESLVSKQRRVYKDMMAKSRKAVKASKRRQAKDRAQIAKYKKGGITKEERVKIKALRGDIKHETHNQETAVNQARAHYLRKAAHQGINAQLIDDITGTALNKNELKKYKKNIKVLPHSGPGPGMARSAARRAGRGARGAARRARGAARRTAGISPRALQQAGDAVDLVDDLELYDDEEGYDEEGYDDEGYGADEEENLAARAMRSGRAGRNQVHKASAGMQAQKAQQHRQNAAHQRQTLHALKAIARKNTNVNINQNVAGATIQSTRRTPPAHVRRRR